MWILIHIRVSPFLLSAWRHRDQTRYLSRFPLWTLAHLRISPFFIIGFLVLVGFVGYLCCFQRLLNPIHSSNYLSSRSSVWSRWHIYYLAYDFFKIHHNFFRDTISWECIVKDDCVTSCFIRIFVFLVHGIHGCKEYRLSFLAWILSSRYQS